MPSGKEKAPLTSLTEGAAIAKAQGALAAARSPATQIAGASSSRPKASIASHWTTALSARNRKVEQSMTLVKGKTLPKAPTLLRPHIAQLNNASSGVFEPGGQYEISGAGFGAEEGSVFIRHAGQTFHLRIDHWADDLLYVGLADISGVPDASSVDLVVGPKGADALTSDVFGFQAARADVTLAPPQGSFTYDKGQSSITVAGLTLWSSKAPVLGEDGGYLTVERSVQPDSIDTPCFPPGFDQVHYAIPLNPGFEVTGFDWYHDGLSEEQDGDTVMSKAGDYAANWDGDVIRIDYGVQRARVAPYALIHGSLACTSAYKIRLTVTGPRGMPPTP